MAGFWQAFTWPDAECIRPFWRPEASYWYVIVGYQEELFKAPLRREKITEAEADRGGRAKVELLRSWRHSGFRVDSSRRIPQGDRKALERLLQHFERAPVSLSQLEYLYDGRVLYRGNFHPSLRRDGPAGLGSRVPGPARGTRRLTFRVQDPFLRGLVDNDP